MNLRKAGIFGISLIGLMVLGLFNTSEAQMQKQQRMTPEQRAQQITQVLTQKLGLSEDQQSKVQEVNLDIMKQQSSIKQDQSMKRKEKIKKLRGLNEEMEKQYQEILTEEQYNDYVALKKKQRKRMKKRMQKRRQQQQQQPQQGAPQ